MISPDVLKSAAAVIPSAKGTLPPIQITTSTISSQAHLQMISHWHDELEFIYILDGKMDFHIEEKILTASRGDFLAIHASAMHRSAPHNGENCRFIRALIHPSLLTENQSVRNRLLSPLLGNTSRRYFLVSSASPDAPRLGALLQEINRTNEKHPPRIRAGKHRPFTHSPRPSLRPFPSRKADAGRDARYRYKRAAPDGRLYFPPLS